MASSNLKQLLNSLRSANTIAQKEQILFDISSTQLTNVKDVALKGTNLLPVLAEVVENRTNDWKVNFPEWVSSLIHDVKQYDDVFLQEQKATLVSKFRNYLTSGHWGCLSAFRCLARFPSVKLSLVQDHELFNILKQLVAIPKTTESAIGFFNTVTDGCDAWQFKVLSDDQFISQLLASQSWDSIFLNLAQHPDAKILLPPEVLTKASKETSYMCTTIGALLSNDENLAKFQLGADWIERTSQQLNSLVLTGESSLDGTVLNLLDIVLPIANLSVAESFKESLGGKSVVLLLKIVTEKLPNSQSVQPFVTRGRQEASRAIWNFAYKESNCKLIRDANGIKKLRTLAQTKDEIVKKNIEGILYMLAPSHPPAQLTASSETPKGHVMISYNWGNQDTIIKLAKSLKEHGYNIWIDIERMGGSTLEAMADAIEHSELVLMCMSQKYKDSPNCRLEGEYCVNRRIKFLPLMMQPGYRPDGWLGLTLGAKLYYDFTSESNWDTKIAELVKAIGDAGKGSTPVSQSIPQTPAAPIQKAGKSLSEWTFEDIRAWMQAENVSQHFEIFKNNQINGKALVELKHLATVHPKVFIGICKEVGISVYGEILQLSTSLKKLP